MDNSIDYDVIRSVAQTDLSVRQFLESASSAGRNVFGCSRSCQPRMIAVAAVDAQSRAASECGATALPRGTRQSTQQGRDFIGLTGLLPEVAVNGPSNHRHTSHYRSHAVPPVDVQSNIQQQPMHSFITRSTQDALHIRQHGPSPEMVVAGPSNYRRTSQYRSLAVLPNDVQSHIQQQPMDVIARPSDDRHGQDCLSGSFPVGSSGNEITSIAAHITASEFSMDLVVEFLDIGFKVTKIAQLLNMKTKALRYRLQKHRIPAKRVQVSDAELDERVAVIVEKYPNAGHKMMYGLFNSSNGNPYATRERLRASLNRVRLSRNDEPRMAPIKRRVYKVKGPLSMWHIDGHHKLIRWGIVIHGGIDGYSRLITFLGVSYDNRAITVLDRFLEGVLIFGLPVCVRSDFGLENIGVADMMFAARQADGREPFVTGKSTHNQRIERLWRDVFEGCLLPYYVVFTELEREGLLNPSNDVDIFVLHHVSRTLLESTVSGFQEGWNRHPISTVKGNLTPIQLFHSGILEMRKLDGYHPELNQEKASIEYGAREAYILREFTAAGQRKPMVEVRSFVPPLTEDGIIFLSRLFDPSSVSLSNLKQTYATVRNFVNTNLGL